GEGRGGRGARGPARLSEPACVRARFVKRGNGMLKEQKTRVVEQLTERLRDTETLMVADYRGLTMPEIDELQSKLLEAGARFTVVKNTLTRLAADAAGRQAVHELIDSARE